LTNDFAARLHDRTFASPNADGLASAVAAASRPAHATELVADVRGAFRTLVRRLVAMHCGEQITLRFECEGTHDGSWRGLVCATGRYVTFEEHHALTLRGARVASDDVAFDLASILRQVCGQ
jgi:predicted ester cyclase